MTKSHSDIAALLRTGAVEHPHALAIKNAADPAVTYAELETIVRGIATSLQAKACGTAGRRTRFGIVIPNGSEIAMVLLGAAIAGEAAPFNTASTAAEFASFFAATRIDALIVRASESGPSIAVAEAANIPVLRVSSEMNVIGPEAPPQKLTPPSGSDIALVLMTSGSTGRPKIVPLTHGNVCCSAKEVADSLNLGPGDICLTMWEQFHIGGLVDLLLAPLASGGKIVVTGGFNAAEFFALLRAEQPTWYQAVPTTLNEIVLHAERNGISTRPNSLRLIRSVAAALSPALMGRAAEMFGVPVIRTFGMTEASPLITSTPLPPLPQKPGSVGKSCGTQIAIMGPDGPLGQQGAEGEVAIRGANVFAGYEGDNEINAISFRDGWFLTGDLGYIDADGDLFLTGRIKQLINRGGEKISPTDVDNVLASHPAIAEVATFSVPHPTLGEDVAAAVVLRDPVDPSELRSFARSSLAAFKVPQRILIMEKLPRNPVGKIDRLALAQIALTTGSSGHAQITAPRTSLEHLIANIWMQELSLPLADIHQDFTDAGGDSLSLMRILLATEAALGCALSPELFAEKRTIFALAAHLAALGTSAPGSIAEIEQRAATSLESIQAGLEGYEDSVAELMAAIETCSDFTRLHGLADGAILYATATEIIGILDATASASVGRNASRPIGPIERIRLVRTHRRWRRDLRAEIASHPAGRGWVRRLLSESAIHYGDPSADNSGKILVVGFTGKVARLFQPTYRILSNLDPKRFDLLLLRDTSKSLFLNGGRGIGDDMKSVGSYANSFRASSGYEDIIALGTSGGCPAAIHGALTYGWKKAIAVCPPAPAKYPVVGKLLDEVVAQAGPNPCPIILAHGAYAADTDSVHALQTTIPFATVDYHPDYASHNIVHEAYQAGRLKTMFSEWFDNI